MSEFSDQAEPSGGSGYGLSLLVLALGLGVLTIRMKHQQMEQVVEVTKDFKTFQATFMSEQTISWICMHRL